MVALRCAPWSQESGQDRIFVFILRHTAITSSQLRAKTGSRKFHPLFNCSVVYTKDSICPDKTSCQAFYDTELYYSDGIDCQLVSE